MTRLGHVRRWAHALGVLRHRVPEAALLVAAPVAMSAATWRLASPRASAAALTSPAAPESAPIARAPHLRRPTPPRPTGGPSLPTVAAAPLLAQVRARVRSRDPRSPAAEVDRWILRFVEDVELRRGLENGLTRMSRYEPFIHAELRRRRQPEGLLYLVLVESQCREDAVSPAGATGLWQFMSATGRDYALEVSPYVDERRDPVRSTEAAVRLLTDLHRTFGSWHLALAAYNAGEGRIASLLRLYGQGASGDEAYWRIRRHLPRETQAYVPLVLAAAEIARHPEPYGVHPRRLPALEFAERWVAGGVTLNAVARESGAPAERVRALNPHLVRGVTPPGRAWPVRIPVTPVRSFQPGPTAP